MNSTSRQRFAEFYAEFGRPVRNYLFRLGARASLDDLTQETFLRAWKSLANLREEKASKAWVFQIAHHVFIDQGRKKSPLIETPRGPSGDDTSESALRNEDLRPEFGTDASSRQNEARLDANSLLAILPEDQRVACILFYVEEFTSAEIAEILKIPEGTVKTRLMKAREKIQATFPADRRLK